MSKAKPKPEPKTDPDPDQLLTVIEAAGLLRLNKFTIYKYIYDGHLPAVDTSRGLRATIRIRRRDLQAFIDEKPIGPAPPRSVPSGPPPASVGYERIYKEE